MASAVPNRCWKESGFSPCKWHGLLEMPAGKHPEFGTNIFRHN
jgi:hypothetical protein